MLLPMKAVTRHRGMAQTTNPPTQPTMDMIRPSNCMPVVAMAKVLFESDGFVFVLYQSLLHRANV